MGNKRRGRERLENCVSCGRSVPRDKAVDFVQKSFFTTDLRGSADNVTHMSERLVYYCISCGKHRKIFEKKKKMAERNAERNRGGY